MLAYIPYMDPMGYKYYKRLYAQLYLYIHIYLIYFGDPPIYENTQNLSYLISKDQPQFLAGIGHGHGLHNCHLAGDCFDTIGHLKEWEKMGNNPGRGRKRDKEA
jgi:hypothetical protein